MFRALKNWMSGVVLFALIAAQVAPAFALSITFTTEAAPYANNMKVTSVTPAPDATDVALQPTISITFSHNSSNAYDLSSRFHYADGSVVPSDVAQASFNGWNRINVTCYKQLLGSTTYYLDLSMLTAPGETNGLDPNDPDVAAYFTHGTARLQFTTIANIAPQWGAETINSVGGANLVNANNVPINASFFITTSKALDGATVIPANVKLWKGAETTGTEVTLTSAALDTADTTNKTIKVVPNGNLEYSTMYTLVLTNVKDTQNNILP